MASTLSRSVGTVPESVMIAPCVETRIAASTSADSRDLTRLSFTLPVIEESLVLAQGPELVELRFSLRGGDE